MPPQEAEVRAEIDRIEQGAPIPPIERRDPRLLSALRRAHALMGDGGSPEVTYERGTAGELAEARAEAVNILTLPSRRVCPTSS